MELFPPIGGREPRIALCERRRLRRHRRIASCALRRGVIIPNDGRVEAVMQYGGKIPLERFGEPAQKKRESVCKGLWRRLNASTAGDSESDASLECRAFGRGGGSEEPEGDRDERDI